uniref:Uncharacterized protein n=1 Tax=Rhizophora mucronata TaxID=61149 RepID=A0A2P2PC75_RHIMU
MWEISNKSVGLQDFIKCLCFPLMCLRELGTDN